ncbi:asparagine synthetase B [Bacillus sp. BRMEA1]|uniref:asparagine synthase-related protein n=1 Tax=Neobacillus endophyticus TaxID=2738405 RepID=UPI00156442A2|nr:asparagine synthase-related protein [Neobacillus endophyticus]NRD76976.1 asparagine synthetase B [Neobacillus endophyticus]
MSAITGIFQRNEQLVDYRHGHAMMQCLQQFPADQIHTWHSEKVFLGCHGQWITPESVGEILPLYDPNRQCTITADAIIDNRAELFEKLQVAPSNQIHITDSELILLAYYKWGKETPKYLLGDFAFMIWDEQHQQLFGARDPSGYRTLYYYNDPTRFAFSTTIEPLLSLQGFKKELNEQWLAEFLAITGFTDSIDSHMTPYQHIKQIPPFHSITISKQQIKLARYDSFIPKEAIRFKTDEEYVEAFQDVFQKAVDARLRTNRQIGSYLSGGLDSGSVVGFAAKTLKRNSKRLHTFSYVASRDFIGYTPNYLLPDESPYIKKTVDFVGGVIDHYEHFEGKNSYLEVDSLLNVMEMPYKFLQNSFWTKGIFEKAHDHDVGILLNGEKGNFTISWGNAMDYYAHLLKKFKWFRFLKEFQSYNQKVGGSKSQQLNYIAKLGFPVLNSEQTPPEPTRLISNGFAERTRVFEKLKEAGFDESGWFAPMDFIRQRQIIYEKNVYWNSGHTLDSKLSLRYGLWKRDPTNDLRVVRFCLAIPETQYVQNGSDRALIRRATANTLPEAVRMNHRVMGAQAADWVYRMIPMWESFIDEVKRIGQDDRLRDFFDHGSLQAAIKKGEQGPQPEQYNDYDYNILFRTLIVGRFLKNII